MTKKLYKLVIFLVFISCGKEIKNEPKKNSTPTISRNGQIISFPDLETLSFFKTEKINNNITNSDFTAIGSVGATILASSTGASQNIILFENPELATSYTQLIQHQINVRQIQNINIKQRNIELQRTRDLQTHGSATGQDLLNVETALSIEKTSLANEKTALIEHEATLKSNGFNPALLHQAKVGTAYIIADIPESYISKIKEGQSCNLIFTAFPNEKFSGKIEAIADMMDNNTRMAKLRIAVNNSSRKIKAGMFANILFNLNEGNYITINKTSVVTIQGKNYVFIKKSPQNFERKEIQIGQQLGDRIIVYNGLENNDEIALEGVMLLKGLSFGY